MATIVNDRDVLIMSAPSRYNPPTDRGMFLTPSTAVFKLAANGQSASPGSFQFVATLLNITGIVTWSASGGIALATNGNTATLNFAGFTAVSGTITATIVVDGQQFAQVATVTKLADGADGPRGSRGNVDISAVTSGSIWSDSEAAAALAAAGYGAPQVRDMVNLYRADRTFSAQRMYNGSAWISVDYVWNGNVFVKGSILPEAIDTRGLTIRDTQGNVILAAGTALADNYVPASVTNGITNAGTTANWNNVTNRPSDDSIKNNLIDLSFWQRGASIPWPTNSEYNSIATVGPSSGSDLGLAGPKGNNDTVWYCKEIGRSVQPSDAGNGAGGGWQSTGVVLDVTKTYRFVVPIRRVSGTGQAYWGTDNVCTLNTTTGVSNPYFAVGTNLSPDRWYLLVGYVYPAGSTNNTSDNAGVWDCKTGQKIAPGTNYCMYGGPQTTVYHRAYQFYASMNAEQIFGRPMVNLVDGTEPSLREYFESGAVLNTSISVNPDGSLNGAGGGKVTLPGIGQDAYRIISLGSSATSAPAFGAGLYKNGTQLYSAARSYMLAAIDRTTGAIAHFGAYDVFGTGQTNGATAATLAADLNYFANRAGYYIVVVWTYDEPQGNRMDSGLAAAMYRNGASRGVYGSSQFRYRSAYALVGISGCGEGNGAEAYQGSIDADPNAWIDVSFSVVAGNLTGVTLNYSPKTLQDYGYTGDMNATAGATFGVNVGGQITPGNASTYIANLAVSSAHIQDLRTANYAEDGWGNPTAGAKLASQGTALKVANNSFQVGGALFSDYWFRLVQGIDGSVAAGRVIWRGNNDATTRGGAPDVNCLTMIFQSSQVLNSNFQQLYFAYTLTPNNYSSYTDNLDAMQQIHVQLFASNGSTSPFTQFYQSCPSRTYDGVSGIANGSLSWGWRFSGAGSIGTIGSQLESAGLYTGYTRVRLANTYGWSAAADFAPPSGVNASMSRTAISGTAAPPSGGGGSAGGNCPAPWVKVRLANGRDVRAGELHEGARVMAVDDNTLEPLPNGGILRDVCTVWARRYRVKLANGDDTEWSENHRFAVVDRGWVHVQNLRAGDHIMGLEECVVDSVLAVDEGQVVSYRVEGAGTYFAGGMLCHNYKQLP